ncbi:hypothetical protein [Arthrobacter sp. 31Y]|uniref:hypothetical protein n=1 Tax=Arthrobacter sp. 31Y TaxID=1115632 RepID=UPI000466E001|nr:hypothetical protein [Arthrobacter sp. 31Y]
MKITSEQWAVHRRKETELLFEFLKRETEAQSRERGHYCGHQFTISVTSRGHYGLLDETGRIARCDDADWDGEPFTITVRAHDLQAALLRAASHSLNDWQWEGHDEETTNE